MALSGLDIYKLLPKTNCRDCGFPTCLAFALALAKRAVSLDKCIHVSEEAKKALDASALPPIRMVRIGPENAKHDAGNETVLFRHEEKFHHPTLIGFIIPDNLDDNEIKKRLNTINALQFDRIGQLLKTQLIAVKQTKDISRFVQTVKLISQGGPEIGIVLMSSDSLALKEALTVLAGKKPLIYSADSQNISQLAVLAKEHGASLTVKGSTLDELSQLTKKANESGLNDIILDVDTKNKAQALLSLTQIRRQALKKANRSLGYPTITALNDTGPYDEIIEAGDYLAKYSSIILLNNCQPYSALALLTLRQNIYTDPQKPLQIEPKLYQIGNTDDKSPVLITTNFSLTYYTVLGEVEASKKPSNIISVDTEGMSVLTAWAAEKFTPDKIIDTLKKCGIEEKISHRNLIIPGYVAVLSGELEETSGWKIIVGPKEAAGLPAFLKNLS